MTTATVVKRGPGRPRKNPEAVTPEPVVKRGPGRPRKNPEAVTPEPVVKRSPGRPKGSKNKPKVTATVPVAKRGPGRPRKNPEATATPAKRGPGRPKGSKNKPKVTATVPVALRGPGRPRKNPEVATATITATSKTVSKSDSTTRQVLANPFKAGDVVNIPAGSTFTSSAPTLKGRQKVKRGHKVTVVDIIPAHIQPRNSETGSKVLIRPTRIRAKGSGSYWKDITLTEKILKFNGKNPSYKTVSVAAAAEPVSVAATESVDVATTPAEMVTTTGNAPMFSEDI